MMEFAGLELAKEAHGGTVLMLLLSFDVACRPEPHRHIGSVYLQEPALSWVMHLGLEGEDEEKVDQ